jgi:hypothetical protein
MAVEGDCLVGAALADVVDLASELVRPVRMPRRCAIGNVHCFKPTRPVLVQSSSRFPPTQLRILVENNAPFPRLSQARRVKMLGPRKAMIAANPPHYHDSLLDREYRLFALLPAVLH